VANEAQALDSIQLIRRKRGGEGGQETPEVTAAAPAENPSVSSPPALPPASPPAAEIARPQEDAGTLRMKPRETVQLAAVHVRIPEQLARGLRLMSVIEGKQAQVIVAEMLEEHLTRWNGRWKESVPSRDG
jgi:hypothetical protein